MIFSWLGVIGRSAMLTSNPRHATGCGSPQPCSQSVCMIGRALLHLHLSQTKTYPSSRSAPIPRNLLAAVHVNIYRVYVRAKHVSHKITDTLTELCIHRCMYAQESQRRHCSLWNYLPSFSGNVVACLFLIICVWYTESADDIRENSRNFVIIVTLNFVFETSRFVVDLL